MIIRKSKRLKYTIVYCLTAIAILLSSVQPVYAEKSEEDYLAEAEKRKEMTIDTDSIQDWPAGPKLGCESALLMEVNTGAILYEKNSHEHLYPASVTKMLTALIAMEECDMDEMVTFSEEAINSIDWRQDANLGISPGSSITMEQCLYGLLVGSANEVAYAIAEHICGAGNIEGFAELMNKKAESLGCTDSHFITPNGIHDENHYTSAYDLALIAQAFYSNELLTKMASTTTYQVPKTDTQSRDDMIVYAKSKLHPGKEYAYEYLVGTKTGYTDHARQTLVSCADKDGMRLICVVLKEESPYQYTDTIELFNYGFDNFKVVTTSEEDKTYVIQSLNFFSTKSDVFGSSKPILEMNPDDYIVIPIDAEFDMTTSELTYDDLKHGEIARVNYYFNQAYVGSASIEPAKPEQVIFDFGPKESAKTQDEDEDEVIIVNVRTVITAICVIAVLIIVAFIIKSLLVNRFGRRGRSKRKNYKTRGSHQLDWKGFK